MRRLLLTLTVAAASVAIAQPASAQIPLKYGVQGSVMTSLDEVSAGPDLESRGLGVRRPDGIDRSSTRGGHQVPKKSEPSVDGSASFDASDLAPLG